MDKLINLNQFTKEIEDYVHESNNVERGLQLIFAYNDFLSQPIKEEMFIGENPLFPNFVKCSQKEAITKGIENSFNNFGKDEFYVRVYRKHGHENKPGYLTSFHLKTVNDLVGKIDHYNSHHTVFGWNDVE